MVEEENYDPTDPDGEALVKLCDWGKELDRHWSDWIKEAKAAFRMVAGDQYEKDDQNEMKDRGKIPVTFNYVGTIIDAVVGAEIQGRQQTQYMPRQNEDGGVNQILTDAVEWIRDLADAEGEESHAKRDAFICGLGAVKTEIDFEEDEEGRIEERRLNPWKVQPEPWANRGNARDARYIRYRESMAKDAFKELYGETAVTKGEHDGSMPHHTADPRHAYSGDDDARRENMVDVDYWEWYEVITIYEVQNPITGQVEVFDADAFAELKEAADAESMELQYASRRTRRYYYAMLSGKTWLERPQPIEFNKFTIKFITGKLDDVSGVWYGLVRPMTDPQKWFNSFMSMLLHMVRTNAKGGLIVEDGAIEDMDRFLESWASSDEVSLVPEGVLQQGRMQPKPPPQYPSAIDKLMQVAQEGIQRVTGVNEEMLGLVGRDQPGILEQQRKQAAYGLLGVFFESFRRFRKLQGELMLDYIKQLPPETLVRVSGADGNPFKQQYIPLIAAIDEDRRYDVIVDDAPDGPSQRERTWMLFTQLLPAIQDGLTPEMWVEALRHSPLPSTFVEKMAEMMLQQPEPDQQEVMQEQINQIMAQLGIQKQEADIRKTHVEADQKEAETYMNMINPDPNPQVVM